MTDVAVDMLRLRGPGAARLTRVAATRLPAALDRALSDVEDVAIGRIVVTLDLDLDEYDDETLAVLWADAIRTQVLISAILGPRPEAEEGSSVAAAPLHSTAGVWSVAQAWLAAGGRDTALPRTLLALADRSVARAVAASAGRAEWDRLVDALDELLGSEPAAGGGAVRPVPEPDEGVGSASGPGGGAVDQGPGPSTGQAGERSGTDTPADASVSASASGVGRSRSPAEERVAERLAVLAELTDNRAEAVDLASLTRAAGLVLLYPWLADHCRRAEILHPDLDPVDVREAALVAVVDPEDPTLLDDPLVALLAGRRDPAAVPRPDRAPLPGGEAVGESATSVLSSFAALLPGFETSSARFVQEAWVVRTGVLDLDRDPVQVTAATHPLDVLLPLLPYPIGLVRLPWSRVLSVRFRP